jgi:CRISPR/Cas system-associated exonuclease Cas4 (RecB family)
MNHLENIVPEIKSVSSQRNNLIKETENIVNKEENNLRLSPPKKFEIEINLEEERKDEDVDEGDTKNNIKGNILQVYDEFQMDGSQLGYVTNVSDDASEDRTLTNNSIIQVKSEVTKQTDLKKSESTLKSNLL